MNTKVFKTGGLAVLMALPLFGAYAMLQTTGDEETAGDVAAARFHMTSPRSEPAALPAPPAPPAYAPDAPAAARAIEPAMDGPLRDAAASSRQPKEEEPAAAERSARKPDAEDGSAAEEAGEGRPAGDGALGGAAASGGGFERPRLDGGMKFDDAGPSSFSGGGSLGSRAPAPPRLAATVKQGPVVQSLPRAGGLKTLAAMPQRVALGRATPVRVSDFRSPFSTAPQRLAAGGTQAGPAGGGRGQAPGGGGQGPGPTVVPADGGGAGAKPWTGAAAGGGALGAGGAGGGGGGQGGGTLTGGANEMLTLINDARKKKGIAPLEVSPALSKIAADWAAVMSRKGSLEHHVRGAYGDTPNQYTDLYPAGYAASGENVGYAPSVQEIFNGMYYGEQDSNGNCKPNSHCANMVSPNFNRIGIGDVASGPYHWNVQDFARY